MREREIKREIKREREKERERERVREMLYITRLELSHVLTHKIKALTCAGAEQKRLGTIVK